MKIQFSFEDADESRNTGVKLTENPVSASNGWKKKRERKGRVARDRRNGEHLQANPVDKIVKRTFPFRQTVTRGNTFNTSRLLSFAKFTGDTLLPQKIFPTSADKLEKMKKNTRISFFFFHSTLFLFLSILWNRNEEESDFAREEGPRNGPFEGENRGTNGVNCVDMATIKARTHDLNNRVAARNATLCAPALTP